MVAERAKAKQTCPLCGAPVAKEGVEALGEHFQSCPKTAGDRQHQDPRKRKE